VTLRFFLAWYHSRYRTVPLRSRLRLICFAERDVTFTFYHEKVNLVLDGCLFFLGAIGPINWQRVIPGLYQKYLSPLWSVTFPIDFLIEP